MRSIIEFLKVKVRGSIDIERLKKEGLVVGSNFNAMDGVIIDPGHCWLIEIGDNVTLAPRVCVLAHDASMKKSLGYVKIGRVSIGNNCFLGAGTIVLPNVKIDDNSIIAAGAVVSKSLVGGGVFAGNPAHKIFEYEEWIEKHRKNMRTSPMFGEAYRIGKIDTQKKDEMRALLQSGIGYVV